MREKEKEREKQFKRACKKKYYQSEINCQTRNMSASQNILFNSASMQDFGTALQMVPTDEEQLTAGNRPKRQALDLVTPRLNENLLDILEKGGSFSKLKEEGEEDGEENRKVFNMTDAIVIFVSGEFPRFEFWRIGHDRKTTLFATEVSKLATEFPRIRKTLTALENFAGVLPEGLASSKLIKESDKFAVFVEVNVYRGRPYASLMGYFKTPENTLAPLSGAVPIHASDSEGALMAFVHECLKACRLAKKTKDIQNQRQEQTRNEENPNTGKDVPFTDSERKFQEEHNRLG